MYFTKLQLSIFGILCFFHFNLFPQANQVCDTESGEGSNIPVGFCPGQYDQNFFDQFPRKTVKLNFHFILDDSGENNFRPNDDGNGNSSPTGVDVANTLNSLLNQNTQNMQELDLPGENGVIPTHISDLGFDFELYSDPNNQNDLYGGVWFWNNSNYNGNYEVVTGDYLKSLYSQYGNEVMDVFILDESVDDDPTKMGCDYRPPDKVWCNRGVFSGSSAKMANLWHNHTLGTGVWSAQGLMLHEILHAWLKDHSFNCEHCEDIDEIIECNSNNGTDCGIPCTSGSSDPDACCNPWESGSNNVMGYNQCQCAISPCQMKMIQDQILAGAPSWVDYEDDCEEEATIYIEPGPPVIWDGPNTIRSPVVVRTGAVLIIKCDVYTNAHFSVERGARLEVIGATISNLCPGERWNGIRVWGNTSVPHASVDVYNLSPTDPGVLILNGATLNYAGTAVVTDRIGGGWFPDHWGGIILADDTKFTNNRRGVAFMRYDYPNISYFKDCVFSSDDGFAGATIWACDKISFSECQFLDLGHTEENTVGIGGIDMGFSVTDNCYFTDLKYGIYATATFPFNREIAVGRGQDPDRRNRFYRVDYGIYAENIMPLNVRNNEFDLVDYGVAVYQNSEYEIVGNTFEKMKEFGVYSGGHNYNPRNQIEYNYFTSTEGGGIDAFRVNEGLRFDNNCFSTTQDFQSLRLGFIPQQGAEGFPRLNFFTLPYSGPQVYERLVPFDYFHVSDEIYPDVNPEVIPQCAWNSTNCPTSRSRHRNIGTSSEQTAAFCGIVRGDGIEGEGEIPEETDTTYTLAEYRAAAQQLNNLKSVIDNGQTAGLIAQIQQSPNTTSTTSNLLSASPYLSREVLAEVVSSPTMTEENQEEVLLANAPLHPETLELADSFLSNALFDILLAASENMPPSAMDTLNGQIDRAIVTTYEIFQSLSLQYTENRDWTGLVSLLDEEGSSMSQWKKLGVYMYTGDFVTAQATLGNLTVETTTDQQFIAIQQINLNRLSSTNPYVLSIADEDYLHGIADDVESDASSFARGLLTQLKGVYFDIPPSTPLGEKRRKRASQSEVSRDQVLVIPNPANDHVEIKVESITSDVKITQVRLYTSTGVLVKTRIKTDDMRPWEIAHLPDGLYIVEVVLSDQSNRTGKFVKQ